MDLLRHGEVLTALTMNPGAVAGVLGLGLLGLYAAGVLWFRLEPLRPVARSGRIIRLVFFAVLVINWVYLLLAGRA